MTLGRGLNLPALLLAFAVIFAVLLFVLPSPLTGFYLIPAVVLAALVFERLRSSRYSWMVAATITVAIFAQPHLLSVLLQPDGPVWLALVVCILAASAGDSVGRGNARSIILLSLSLAVLMVVDTIGMLLVAFVVPVLMLQQLLQRDRHTALALALLVLFLPAALVVLLSQLHIAPASAVWPVLPMSDENVFSGPQSQTTSPVALFLASAMFLPAALVQLVWPSVRGEESSLYVWLGSAIIAAFTVATLLGSRHDAVFLAASLLPVTVALLASLKPTRNRDLAATSATLFCMAGGWATLAL